MGSCGSCMNKGYFAWGANNLDNIELKKHKLIGVGAFGRVWAATLEKYQSGAQTYQQEGEENTVYAIKEMNKAIILAQGANEAANNEVKLMQLLPKN